MAVIQRIVEYLKAARLRVVNNYIEGRLLDIGCGDNTLVKKYHPDGMLLKPGGKIIITMPIGFAQKLWHRITHNYDDDQLFRGINEAEERYYIPITEIIAALIGYKLEKRERFVFGLNNLIIAMKATGQSQNIKHRLCAT
ncbi:MAG: hypothetical protein BZ151_11715 [Desulfobacca sp. 4484_104]|nr:MAG: hypothetical protein BZ151_11715 [Desulfobacca sp. 4484_104]